MTQTDMTLTDLKQAIPHLKTVSEKGWEMKWGEGAEPIFELVCKGASAESVKGLDKTLSQAYQAMQQQNGDGQTEEPTPEA
jgi:hypothetical protein